MAQIASLDRRSAVDDPFRRDGLSHRALPFFIVAAVAEASLALSPGPSSIPDTVISAVLLLTTAACFFLPWKLLPDWVDVAVPLLYTGSTLTLILAAGGSTAGVGLVVLLPIVWTALYLQPWKSAVVVGAVVGVEIITTYVPTVISDTVRLRRIVFFVAIGALLAYSIHELRHRITRAREQSEALNIEMAHNISQLEERSRASALLSELADMLHSCVDRSEAYEVIAHSAEKMFALGGSVSILNASKDQLETTAAWGQYPSGQPAFVPNDCWALRRGQRYESKPGSLYCQHLKDFPAAHSLCRPLLAQGEIIGVLSIALPTADDGSHLEALNEGSMQQLVVTAGEQIATSMANFQLRESLRSMSIRDPLTNLFNRRYMEETLHRELSGAARTLDELSVIQIDVDHFKNFNDSYGHEVGDAVLRAVGDVLLSLFRDSDVPCRSGGEEFTVVLPKCSWVDAERRAQDLQGSIAALDFSFRGKGSRPTPPTLSIGISTSPEHGTSGTDLLRAADLALYAAKAGGRNRIERALHAKGELDGGYSFTVNERPARSGAKR
jgi:diguanylate cyclase (GGDEF)-like protein